MSSAKPPQTAVYRVARTRTALTRKPALNQRIEQPERFVS